MYRQVDGLKVAFWIFIFFIAYCSFCESKSPSAPAPKWRGAPDKLSLEKIQGLWVGDYFSGNTNNPRRFSWDIWEDILTEQDSTISTVDIDRVTNTQIVGRQKISVDSLRTWEIDITYFNYQRGILEGKYTMFSYELNRYSILEKKVIGAFNFTLRRQ